MTGIDHVCHGDRPVDAGHRLLQIPEHQRVLPRQRHVSIMQGVAGDERQAVSVLYADADAADRVPGEADHPDTGNDLVAIVRFAQIHPLEDVPRPRGRGPVSAVRLPAVLAFVRMDKERSMVEDVDVLDVVPVSMGEHDYIDVRGTQPAGGQRIPEERPAADVRRVDEDADGPPRHVSTLDEQDRAQGRESLVRVDTVAVQ